jgi:hypothetical protein
MSPDTSYIESAMVLPAEQVDSVFDKLELLPADAGLERLPAEFNADGFAGKVALGAGVYCTEEGNSWILPAVQKVHSVCEGIDSRRNNSFMRMRLAITIIFPSLV